MQFNSLVLIKSNNAFILFELLMNDMYFLTHLSYSINVIENIDDEQLPLSKKRKVSNETYLWHLRLGHINPNIIHGLVKSGILNSLIFEPIPICESFLEGKMTKRPFKAKGNRATKQLEFVHTDVCGPMSVQARGGYEYFITFTDDYSRYGYVYLMCHKAEAFEKFREYKAKAKNQLGIHIMQLRSDQGDEHLSREFKSYLAKEGIISKLSSPSIPPPRNKMESLKGET